MYAQFSDKQSNIDVQNNMISIQSAFGYTRDIRKRHIILPIHGIMNDSKPREIIRVIELESFFLVSFRSFPRIWHSYIWHIGLMSTSYFSRFFKAVPIWEYDWKIYMIKITWYTHGPFGIIYLEIIMSCYMLHNSSNLNALTFRPFNSLY